MLQFQVNSEKSLVHALSNLDSEEFIMIEIDNEMGYHIIDLYYEPKTDNYSMFDNCEINFGSNLSEMEDYIIRYYHL